MPERNATTSAATSTKGVFLARVIANRALCREHWRFTLAIEDFPPAQPGQFIQIRCTEPGYDGWTGGAFIRRPFSIGGLRRRGRDCEIDILHRTIGVGTRWLSQLQDGDSVSVLGPLGRPFPIPADAATACLVGGGIGLPPLIWLAESLMREGKRVMAFAGSRTADLLPLTRDVAVPVEGDQPTLAWKEFAQFGVPCILATDDGSLGAAGMVPDVFAAYLDAHAAEFGPAIVYTCGPDRMMRAVADACHDRNISCRVCLERMMACGMGTCQSCVVRVRDNTDAEGWRYRLCCTDGPVFDSRDVIWAD